MPNKVMGSPGKTMVWAPTAHHLMEGTDKKHDTVLCCHFVSYCAMLFQKIIKLSKGGKMEGIIIEKKI